MNINKIKPITKTILNILQEKHNVFDLQEKVKLNLAATRQVIVRLMEYKYVNVCETKLDDIKQRRLTYYQITETGKEILKKINEANCQGIIDSSYGVEETKKNDVKKVVFYNHSATCRTKAFIKTLTKKATPWDALLNH